MALTDRASVGARRGTELVRDPVAVTVGDEMPLAESGPITRTQIVRYAGASGDFNPIHHDEEFARRAGMPSVFAHGLLSAGLLAMQLARWLGANNIRNFRVRFTGQVWPGDVVRFHGQIDRIEEVDGERLAEVRLRATRQSGDAVLEGGANALVA